MSVSARHARPRPRPLFRRLAALSCTAALTGAVLAAPGSGALAADEVDPCLRPELSDVMVSQGLPTYDRLTRGKTALVRYFLSTPSCAPAGTTIEVTGGLLKMSTRPEKSIPLSASVPLPPAPPRSAGPLPGYNGDALFVVPGDLLLSTNVERFFVKFEATLNFTTKVPGVEPANGSLTIDQFNGQDVGRNVERPSNPLRVLVVPMGSPASPGAAFPAAARTALQNGMKSLARVLPVADGVMEMDPTNPSTSLSSPLGVRYAVNPGLLDISAFMPGGVFCGAPSQFDTIESQLLKTRNDYNLALAAAGRSLQKPVLRADVVLGVVWQGISRGPLTGEPDSSGCIEGYGRINGTASWARIVDEKPPASATDTSARPGVTGSLSAMEIMHNVGGVPSSRSDGGFHSPNEQADGTAPNRAWNLLTREHIVDDRSVLKFATTGWHDGSTLLEPADWTYLQCFLTPLPTTVGAPPPTSPDCPNPGSVGGRYGASAQVEEAVYLAGTTDGTPGGTDLHSYVGPADVDDADPLSEYKLVQRDLSGRIVSGLGIPVATGRSGHDGDHGGDISHGHASIGVTLPLHPDAAKIQVYKGDPTADNVPLYERTRNGAPVFVGTGVNGRTITVTVTDETPNLLRLGVVLECPSGLFPVVVDARPTRHVTHNTVVFDVTYDSSRDCPLGRLSFRVTDGFTVSEQDGSPQSGLPKSSAAIYAPFRDAVFTQFDAIHLSGAGRDEQDRPAPVRWRVAAPGVVGDGPVAGTGDALTLTRGDGFAAGRYRVVLEVLDRVGNVTASAQTTFVVVQDEDRDGIPSAVEDAQPCFGSGARTDPSSAWGDGDRDGLPNVSDPQPCTSRSNVTVSVGAQTLKDASQGEPVTFELTNAPFDLRALKKSDLYISQVGYHFLDTSQCGQETPGSCLLPAIHWDAQVSSAVVKFDRAVLVSLLRDKGLSGYVPIFVGAHRVYLHGADPKFPNYFPTK